MSSRVYLCCPLVVDFGFRQYQLTWLEQISRFAEAVLLWQEGSLWSDDEKEG